MSNIRRIALVGSVLFVLNMPSAEGVLAQRPAGEMSADTSTKYERFASRKGILVIRTFHDVTPFRLGPLYDYQVRGVVLALPGESEKVFAVTIKRTDPKRFSSTTAVLDFDEAVSLLDALDMLTKMSADMKATPSLPYTEVYFSTRAGFELGLYQSKGEQKAYMSLGRLDADSTAFGTVGLFDEVRVCVGEAVEKLRAAGAR